jgi:hypothetical protein
MLPQFFPELWGQSKYREWHTGHKHKKMEWKFAPVASAGGTVIRQIPTLSPIDAWHYQEGFVDAIPAGESFIWSKQNGVIAHFTAYCGTHSREEVMEEPAEFDLCYPDECYEVGRYAHPDEEV